MQKARTFFKTQAMDSSGWTAVGQTKNFRVFSQTTLSDSGLAIGKTLLSSCETDLLQIGAWFGKITPSGLPFNVFIKDGIDGAMHYGCGDTEIYVGSLAKDKVDDASGLYSILLEAEVVEVFEANVNLGWHCGYSNGEVLSRVLSVDLHPESESLEFVTSASWLDDKPAVGPNRANWIDQTDPEDTNKFSLGCGVLFLNWLRYVESYSWTSIVAAGADTLAGVYENLTGKNLGWPAFIDFIDKKYPPGTPTKLATDNPFRPMAGNLAVKPKETQSED